MTPAASKSMTDTFYREHIDDRPGLGFYCGAEIELWDVGPVPTGQLIFVRWEPDLHVL